MPERARLLLQGDGQKRQHDGQEAESHRLRPHQAHERAEPAREGNDVGWDSGRTYGRRIGRAWPR